MVETNSFTPETRHNASNWIAAESLYEVFVAAKSNNDLAYLDDLNISWQYNSRKFGEGVYR